MPAPVDPIIAVVCPGRAVKEMLLSTWLSAPSYPKETLLNATVPSTGVVPESVSGSTIDGVVPRTSPIRSAQTIARGIIMAINVPIMTAMRICSRYWRNAVRAPT